MAVRTQALTMENRHVMDAREEAEVAAYNFLKETVSNTDIHLRARIRAAAVLVGSSQAPGVPPEGG